MFIYECTYALCRIVGRPPLPMRWLKLRQIKTTFGTFNIRPGTIDVACVSPSFERPDVDHLLALLSERLRAGKSVLFVDVGADVGTYALSVANRLGGLGNIRVLAFEPSSSSYALLRQNINENQVSSIVEAREIALGDGTVTSAILRFDPIEPGASGFHLRRTQGLSDEEVQVSTIDEQVNLAGIADVVAFKLDVEGSEAAVLSGAVATLGAIQEGLLLVEDFVDASVIGYLEQSGWCFLEKLTPYNSFWRIQAS
jgi:FkbM family methyltransferase